MKRRSIFNLFGLLAATQATGQIATTNLIPRPNAYIPHCPGRCGGKTGTFIIGQSKDLPECWDCACNDCGIRFIHWMYLPIPKGEERMERSEFGEVK